MRAGGQPRGPCLFGPQFRNGITVAGTYFLYGQFRNWYAASVMGNMRRWPTPWAFSLVILPLGMYVGFIGTALPFLLSRAGVPVEETLVTRQVPSAGVPVVRICEGATS